MYACTNANYTYVTRPKKTLKAVQDVQEPLNTSTFN